MWEKNDKDLPHVTYFLIDPLNKFTLTAPPPPDIEYAPDSTILCYISTRELDS